MILLNHTLSLLETFHKCNQQKRQITLLNNIIQGIYFKTILIRTCLSNQTDIMKFIRVAVIILALIHNVLGYECYSCRYNVDIDDEDQEFHHCETVPVAASRNVSVVENCTNGCLVETIKDRNSFSLTGWRKGCFTTEKECIKQVLRKSTVCWSYTTHEMGGELVQEAVRRCTAGQVWQSPTILPRKGGPTLYTVCTCHNKLCNGQDIERTIDQNRVRIGETGIHSTGQASAMRPVAIIPLLLCSLLQAISMRVS